MIEQGSPEWLAIRLGKVTASRITDVMSKVKSGESAGRKNYKMDLVVERLTNSPTSSFSSPAMQWGTETEPLARMAYEAFTGVFVDQVAFCNHPTIEWFGCSPDGLIGSEGNLEIKCPNTAAHISYLKADSVPSKYRKQILWQIACTNRKWCDFVSFDPRLDASNQLFVKRLEPTMEEIKTLEEEVKIFLAEVDAEEKWLIERGNKK